VETTAVNALDVVVGAEAGVVVVSTRIELVLVEFVFGELEAFVRVKTSIKRSSGLDNMTRCAARNGDRRSDMVLAG
jgi:hypothetical protein